MEESIFNLPNGTSNHMQERGGLLYTDNVATFPETTSANVSFMLKLPGLSDKFKKFPNARNLELDLRPRSTEDEEGVCKILEGKIQIYSWIKYQDVAILKYYGYKHNAITFKS